ncbi:MAG: hypothetical protein ACW99G_14335 [Candidatus Thorarchaeota archaeon]|jgi:hypothetical protein
MNDFEKQVKTMLSCHFSVAADSDELYLSLLEDLIIDVCDKLELSNTEDIVKQLIKRSSFKGFICYNKIPINNVNLESWQKNNDFHIDTNLSVDKTKIVIDHFSKIIEDQYL